MSGRMRELLNGQERILKTVTMGVSEDWFEQIPDTEKKPHQILSLRGHQEIYNIDIIIRAMAEVIQKLPEAELVIAGEGPETQNLKALVKSLNLDGNIQFVGQLPHAKVQGYLNESAVSVSVPSSDATAVSLLETMACGSFPVVSDLPANREWIDPQVNGLLVPAKEVHTLAEALIHALEDSGLRIKAQELNRQRVKEKAIWEENMREMEELYDLIQGKK
jgi:glycosyltransferase involved in cell wall biosynthesis